MRRYEIEEYVESNGKIPFREWLLAIKDATARAKILARIDRASYGNLGDWKAIKNAPGLFEMREHYGPGYRVYYAVMGQKICYFWRARQNTTKSKRLPLHKCDLATIARGLSKMKKTSNPKPSASFDDTRFQVLQDPHAAAIYLDECLADGNMELFTESLCHVAKARLGGIAPLAETTELGRETLYRTLSKQGNPRLDTLNKVLTAVGLRLSITEAASH